MPDGPDPQSLTGKCEKRPPFHNTERRRRADEEEGHGKGNGQPGAMAKQPATNFKGDCAIVDW
jgi:hypothetical protein